MEAGRLNCRVIIERRVVDSDGESVRWEFVKNPKAYVRMLSGKDVIAADAPMSQVKASVRIRYRKALCQALRGGMRVTVADTLMRIEAVLPDLLRHEHIDLVCVSDDR